ncbi:hypothetical protein [Cerasicoccus arenae]|uniref:Uncharacterized protein n=1 Tax=Cerasicoccus arenae TaxID=424488 RepID=A0A8J3GEE0_9BACT|nr:hypothetical protein [Cerasicoccus arenae]MBK1859947.1 hypothetical protein [Cerasicoccus arenae]GHC08485.1 hypothetical protein GCM10007047_27230 [Cerasicoccus arenae]
MITKKGLVLLAAVYASVAFPHRVLAESKPVLSNDTLTLEAGDYQLKFSERGAWTIDGLSYKGAQILVDNGANQTVVKLKARPDLPSKYEFVGTKHGGEVIESLILEVDGEQFPVKQPFSAPKGSVYKLIKVSRFAPYFRGYWEVTLSSEGLTESARFDMLEDTFQVDYAYVFMHCWSPKMTEWEALLANGKIDSGVFPSKSNRALETDVKATAFFSEADNVGAVLVYEKVYKGVSGRKSFLKYRSDYYNKQYLCVNRNELAEENYECKIVGFSVPRNSWKAVAEELMTKACPNG